MGKKIRSFITLLMLSLFNYSEASAKDFELCSYVGANINEETAIDCVQADKYCCYAKWFYEDSDYYVCFDGAKQVEYTSNYNLLESFIYFINDVQVKSEVQKTLYIKCNKNVYTLGLKDSESYKKDI